MSFIAYRITRRGSSKCYIGVTTRSLRARWTDHKECCGNGKRGKLYSAMRKYGIGLFHIEHIASAKTVDDLFALERQLIEQERSFARGYNMTLGGDGPTGLTHTAESRERMRRAHIGTKRHPDAVAKTAAANRGRKFPPRPPEWSAKISAAHKGRKWTPEQRDKMVAIMTGRVFTPEWCAKISAAKKGKGPSPEQAAAHSLKMRGRKMPPRTPEHCAKLAAGLAAAWARRKALAEIGVPA